MAVCHIVLGERSVELDAGAGDQLAPAIEIALHQLCPAACRTGASCTGCGTSVSAEERVSSKLVPSAGACRIFSSASLRACTLPVDHAENTAVAPARHRRAVSGRSVDISPMTSDRPWGCGWANTPASRSRHLDQGEGMRRPPRTGCPRSAAVGAPGRRHGRARCRPGCTRRSAPARGSPAASHVRPAPRAGWRP